MVYKQHATVAARPVPRGARQLAAGLVVKTATGVVHADPGDWIVDEPDGRGGIACEVVKAAAFAARYAIADPATALPREVLE